MNTPNFELIAHILGDYHDMQADGIVEAANRFPLAAVEEQLLLLGQFEPAGNATLANRIVELEREKASLAAERDALGAQVEVLLLKVSKANKLLSKGFNNQNFAAEDINHALCILAEAEHFTSSACLAQVRAEAVEQALDVAGVPCTQFNNQSDDFTAGFNFCGAQLQLHANLIRQEVK